MHDLPNEPINVGYTSEIFFSQNRGGISRLFSSLIQQYYSDKSFGIQANLMFANSANKHLGEANPSIIKNDMSYILNSIRLTSGLGAIKLRNLIISHASGSKNINRDVDIIHLTGFAPLKEDSLVDRPIVITVHDLIPLRYPEHFKYFNPQPGLKKIISQSSLIIVPSFDTKNACEEFFGDSLNLTVIPHGVNHAVFNTFEEEKPSEDFLFPYILFVGKRHKYKQFKILVDAIGILRNRNLDIGLIAIGGEKLLSREISQIHTSVPPNRFKKLNPNDTELASLYRNALTFCFPSEAEGFGLPTLEAMSSGCTCVLTDIPIFREITSNTGVFFQKGDSESLAMSIEKIITDSELKRNLISDGLRIAKEFSWQKAAKQHSIAYRNILN